eukprot:1131012-Pelagomonas_calceolata.AAC.1
MLGTRLQWACRLLHLSVALGPLLAPPAGRNVNHQTCLETWNERQRGAKSQILAFEACWYIPHTGPSMG